MRTGILFFTLGIYFLQVQQTLPSSFLFFGGSFSFLIYFFFQRFIHVLWIRRICIVVFSFIVGMGYAAWRAESRLETRPLAQDFHHWESKSLTLIGRVKTFPIETEQQGVRFIFQNQRKFAFSVPQNLSLSLPIQTVGQPIHVGMCLKIVTKLMRPYGTANPYTFDLEKWAYEQHIDAFGKVRTVQPSAECAPQYFVFSDWIEATRERLRDRYLNLLKNQPYQGILIALAIGDQRGVTPAQWEIFYKTGVTHLISISGLHVTMIASFFATIIMTIWKQFPKLILWRSTKEIGAFVGFVTALVYSLIAGFSVPTQRTMLMLMVIAFALYSRLSLSSFDILCYALLFVLLMDPLAVQSIGFWLSFGAVAALMFAGAYRTKRPDFLKETIKSQWVATIALIPLILILFQQISLVSPLANALAIPLVSLMITPLTLIGLMPFGEIILWIAGKILLFLMLYLNWLSHFSFAIWEQQAPNLVSVILGFLGIGLLLLPHGFAGKYFGTVFLLPLFLTGPSRPPTGEAFIHILDVGNGFAIWIETTHFNLIFDTGPKYSVQADSGERIVTPTLRAAGVKKINMLMVSHEDNDHSGGLESIVKHFEVADLRSSMVENHARRKHPHIKKNTLCLAGQKWEWDQVYFEVLHPTKEDYQAKKLEDNNMSCVLKIKTAHQSFLLTGDIEAPIEKRLVETLHPQQLKSTILLAPHHGSQTSSTWPFLAAVQPKIAILSVGYRNQYGHPHPVILKRYHSLGIQTYRTDQLGYIRVTLHSQPAPVNIWFYRPNNQYYWMAPLSGSIMRENKNKDFMQKIIN